MMKKSIARICGGIPYTQDRRIASLSSMPSTTRSPAQILNDYCLCFVEKKLDLKFHVRFSRVHVRIDKNGQNCLKQRVLRGEKLIEFVQVLTYGAERQVILKATDADGDCVLACALAARFLVTQSNKERTPEAYLNAAKANLVIIYDRSSVLIVFLICAMLN